MKKPDPDTIKSLRRRKRRCLAGMMVSAVAFGVLGGLGPEDDAYLDGISLVWGLAVLFAAALFVSACVGVGVGYGLAQLWKAVGAG